MIPVSNDYTGGIDDIGPDFKELSVHQIVEARNGVFQEMRKELKVTTNHEIQKCNLDKRSVTKDKLIHWLETVCFILDSCCVPLLENAVPLVEKVGELQEDMIDRQARILELQRELILKREEEIKAVQNTVKKEMKTYSAVVEKSCSVALSTKKIEAAVRKVADEEDRSKNIIVYGAEESLDENIEEKVEKVLEEIGEKPLVRDCVRVGFKKSDVNLPRPFKFTLTNSDHVAQVLRNARRLHTKEGYKTVYICPDRTAEERRAHKKLLELLREKRTSEPHRVHVIKFNRVVSFDKSEG